MLAKLLKQPDSTWAPLQKRLVALPEPTSSLFDHRVSDFLQRKADSLSTSAGFLVPSLITTTALVAGMNSTISHGSHEMPINLFSIFVAPPTTGKSQAIKEAAKTPMVAICEDLDLPDIVLHKCTSSGRFKTVSEYGKEFLMSAEIYDVLHKLLKSDNENATADAQVLCELFSGEKTSYRYASEKTRHIAENTPFCILGSTQVPFAARLIAQLDQGHGILHGNFIEEINQALQEGRTPPKSKKVDVTLRMAASVHILNHVISKLLDGQKPDMPDLEVTRETLAKTISYVGWAESQKEIFVEVSLLIIIQLLVPNNNLRPGNSGILIVL